MFRLLLVLGLSGGLEVRVHGTGEGGGGGEGECNMHQLQQ